MFYREILQLDKFKGAYFQIPAQKYINQAFLVLNLGIFVFSWNFENRQI